MSSFGQSPTTWPSQLRTKLLLDDSRHLPRWRDTPGSGASASMGQISTLVFFENEWLIHINTMDISPKWPFPVGKWGFKRSWQQRSDMRIFILTKHPNAHKTARKNRNETRKALSKTPKTPRFFAKEGTPSPSLRWVLPRSPHQWVPHGPSPATGFWRGTPRWLRYSGWELVRIGETLYSSNFIKLVSRIQEHPRIGENWWDLIFLKFHQIGE